MVEKSHFFEGANDRRDTSHFTVLTAGRFNKDQVKVSMHPKPQRTRDLESLLSQTHSQSNRKELRGTYAFLHDPQVQGGQLQLAVFPSTFAEFVATRQQSIRDVFGKEIGDPVAISTVVQTKDNKLALDLLRTGNMGVISGYPETDFDMLRAQIPDKDIFRNWDPFKTITRELHEETGIKPDDLKDVAISGIVFNNLSKQPIITSIAATDLTSDEIRNRENEQGVQLRFIENDQNDIEKLMDLAPAIVPTGIASLLLYGKTIFGEMWYDAMLRRLQSNYGDYEKMSKQEKLDFREQAASSYLAMSEI